VTRDAREVERKKVGLPQGASSQAVLEALIRLRRFHKSRPWAAFVFFAAADYHPHFV
jgi:hypothetical protein